MLSKDSIIDAVCEVMDVSREDLLGRRRTNRVAIPRQMAMWLLHEMGNRTLYQVAGIFDRDHTTVMWACRRSEYRLETDGNLREAHQRILAKLAEQARAA